MSQHTMELAERMVKAINETYRTRDMRPFRKLCEEVVDPGIVLETDGEAFTEGEWHGVEGVVDFVANQMEVLDEMWLRVDEYLHVGADLLVGAISFGGRAQHTGIEVELHPLHVFRLDDSGKVVQWQVFLDRAKALQAAGLQDWAMSQENVEIVRAVIEAWNSRNMDALRELYDPDVVMRMPEGWPEPGPHVGSRSGNAPLGANNEKPWMPMSWSRSASSTPPTE